MERLEQEKKIEHKVIKRFVSHETKLIKSSNDLVSYKLRETWEALHYKYIELNQKLVSYIALQVKTDTPLVRLFGLSNAPTPTIIICVDEYTGYYLYELEKGVYKDESSKAFDYFKVVENEIKDLFMPDVVYSASTIANPLNEKFKLYISDKRYELTELRPKIFGVKNGL